MLDGMTDRRTSPKGRGVKEMRARFIGVLLAGAVVGVSLMPAVGLGATAKAKSTTSILSCCSKSSGGKYQVIAVLQPEHADAKMRFNVYKRQSGTFVKYASVLVPAQSSGDGSTVFAGSLKPASKALCKITAKFEGDDDHNASSDSIKFNCKTGQPA
jgi:hypothetical protein